MAFDAEGTIGGMPCEKSLGRILFEINDPKLINKSLKILRLTRQSLKDIALMPEAKSRDYFRNLLRKDIEARIVKLTGVPVRGVPVTNRVASHMMCCVHAYFWSMSG